MGPVTVVFDTNVILSAAGFGGVPERSIVRAFRDDVEVVTSPDAMTELERVLEYDRLPFDDDASTVIPGLFLHLTDSDVVEPTESIHVFDDPDDNVFLECALEADAEYLVSGDEGHVQVVDEYRGIDIVSPREFLVAVGAG